MSSENICKDTGLKRRTATAGIANAVGTTLRGGQDIRILDPKSGEFEVIK